MYNDRNTIPNLAVVRSVSVVNRVAPFAQRAERLLIIEGNRAAEANGAGGEAAADAAVTDKPWTIYIHGCGWRSRRGRGHHDRMVEPMVEGKAN